MDTYNLDTGKNYIKDIFASDCFYSIPEYQRPYVWGRDQILELLEDIHSTFEVDDKKEYFIGCMIWNTRKGVDANIEYRCQDILDGQQRFISLYLLHGVFRDLSHDSKLKEKVGERLRQEADEFDNIPARNRIVFEIRKDREFLEEFLLTDGGTTRESDLVAIADDMDHPLAIRNMASAVLTMRGWFRERATELGEEDLQTFLRRFFSYLSSRVLALYLATPNNLDDAYNLFTVLNNRGMQLQVSDILRAQNLRTIDDEKLRKSYAEKWEQFQNTIDSPFRSFDDFLWALVFVKMKYRSDDNKSLQKAFNFMFNRNMLEKGAATFDFVGKYTKHYEKIASGEASVPPEAGRTLHNLHIVLSNVYGNVYMAPLLHYRETFGDHRITDFMIKLDNLLSVPWMIGKRSEQTRNFILLRKMDETLNTTIEQGEDRQTAADTFLRADCLRYDYRDPNANTFLDIEEFFRLLETEKWGGFAGTRINKTRYLLLKLDFLLSGINTQIQFDRAHATVEHLMPQKLSAAWQVSPDDHREWLHRLGNIILLDAKKNASLSNKAYGDKKQGYQGGIEARANTNYVLMNNAVWTVDTIKDNHQRILDLLRAYYTGNSLETLLAIKKANSKVVGAQRKLSI